MIDIPGKHASPVVIGGIGGSGTRLIAQCLKELGFFMGSDLNVPNDNLWFTFLFKRIEVFFASDEEFDRLVDILYKKMTGISECTREETELIDKLASFEGGLFSKDWLRERHSSLIDGKTKLDEFVGWGWKEPNSHIFIDRLRKRFPLMKYIHVVRNGLDMAYSNNQKQLKLWGKHLLGGACDDSPRFSLKYWCFVHRRILDLFGSSDPGFYFLNYDNFCLYPDKEIGKLVEFLGMTITGSQFDNLKNQVSIPESIGRFKQHDISYFDQEDVSYVKQLGFVTDAA